MKPSRLAVFTPTLAGGGAERAMLNLARGLADRDLSVDLVLGRATGPYRALVPANVRLVDLGARRLLFGMTGLMRYLRRERPALLITASLHGSVAALWARRWARSDTPTYVTVHNSRAARRQPHDGLRARILRALVRRAFPTAEGIIAVSHGVAADIAAAVGVPQDQIRVIPNPVVTPDLEQALGVAPAHPWFQPAGPPVVLAIGRLTWEKDFGTLIRAFAEVRQRQAARLVILGEGPERGALTDLVRAMQLADVVDLPGFVENPYSFMARARVFVLSSVTEGLPTVLIEALAAGCPVVATDCPSGPREILEDGRYGRLVPVSNARALADAIVTTMHGPRAPTPETAWRRFTVAAAVDRYLELLCGRP